MLFCLPVHDPAAQGCWDPAGMVSMMLELLLFPYEATKRRYSVLVSEEAVRHSWLGDVFGN